MHINQAAGERVDGVTMGSSPGNLDEDSGQWPTYLSSEHVHACHVCHAVDRAESIAAVEHGIGVVHEVAAWEQAAWRRQEK